MRTTLDIEDDLLIAAKEMARREHTSAGRIVSRLMRQALTQLGGLGAKFVAESPMSSTGSGRSTPAGGW